MNQSPSDAMIVEFIGTPGAGKTTFMPVVKDFFASRGLHAWSVLEASRPFAQRTKMGSLINSLAPSSLKNPLLWQVFYQSSRMHRTAFRNENRDLLDSVLRFQSTRPISQTDLQHVLRWFINLSGQYHFLREHAAADDVLIFDEGFVHRVVQLFASEIETPDKARIQAYLDLIPLPDLILIPQASLETCIERIHRRGIWDRFKDRGEEVVFRFMTNAFTVVNLAVDYLQTKNRPIIQIINEDQPPSKTSLQLHQKLSGLYQPAASDIFMSMNV
jgi:thymidylate kinase